MENYELKGTGTTWLQRKRKRNLWYYVAISIYLAAVIGASVARILR